MAGPTPRYGTNWNCVPTAIWNETLVTRRMALFGIDWKQPGLQFGGVNLIAPVGTLEVVAVGVAGLRRGHFYFFYWWGLSDE